MSPAIAPRLFRGYLQYFIVWFIFHTLRQAHNHEGDVEVPRTPKSEGDVCIKARELINIKMYIF